MASLRLNPGQSACPEDCNYKRVGLLSNTLFLPKSPTELNRKFVRGLSTLVRDFNAIVVYSNHAQAMKTFGCQCAI
jgi:hypothetical protein